MYRPKAYAVDDIDVLHAVIRRRRFATIAAAVDGDIRLAYAPVVLDATAGSFGRIRFHLARANPLSAIAGVSIRLSFLGPDAYISPDWYETGGLVPTWNYVAVECGGPVRRINHDELRQLLVDLSAMEEGNLTPKAPWTMDKVSEQRIAALMNAIVGFEVVLETLEGKFKLSQDKNSADAAGATTGLETCGDASSVAVANAMREVRNRN